MDNNNITTAKVVCSVCSLDNTTALIHCSNTTQLVTTRPDPCEKKDTLYALQFLSCTYFDFLFSIFKYFFHFDYFFFPIFIFSNTRKFICFAENTIIETVLFLCTKHWGKRVSFFLAGVGRVVIYIL